MDFTSLWWGWTPACSGRGACTLESGHWLALPLTGGTTLAPSSVIMIALANQPGIFQFSLMAKAELEVALEKWGLTWWQVYVVKGWQGLFSATPTTTHDSTSCQLKHCAEFCLAASLGFSSFNKINYTGLWRMDCLEIHVLCHKDMLNKWRLSLLDRICL